MKNKAELKAAMESLQVKKPLRLQDRQPQFKAPPSIVIPTLAPVETQVDPRTQVAVTTEVSLQTKVPDSTQVASPTEVAVVTTVPEKTVVDVRTQVSPSTQVSIETKVLPQTTVDLEAPVSAPAQVVSPATVPVRASVVAQTTDVEPTQVFAGEGGTRSASDQDSSVTLEAQAAPKLHQGYTRLPNAILMRMANGELIRSEMQVLLLIARFTISFQRRHAPLSKTVLERQSGMRGPAVLHAISSLQSKGLIEKIPGDQHRPNQLGLVFEDEWEFFSKAKTPSSADKSVSRPIQATTKTEVPSSSPVNSGSTAGGGMQTGAGVPGSTSFKDIKTIKNKNSLSELPETLLQYFDGLKPAKKRESEWKEFQNLQADYTAHDIGECLTFLQERGVGAGNEIKACHSPMAFLGRAMSEVLAEVESRRKKACERSERERRESEAEQQRRDVEAREAAEWEKKERAFEKAFPGDDRQNEVLAEFCMGVPFSPCSQAGRVMAIGRWWDGLNQTERLELSQ